jgi:mannose-1-phosphate guanylyltransferase
MLKGFLSRFSRMNYKDHLYALILAGGGGTRLWPVSRNNNPKQFLKLFKDETLTQITVARLRKILPFDRIYIVTVSEAYKDEILKEIPRFHKENIIVEPARRETGPAHGLGAIHIYKKDPDAVIITESADRIVRPITLYLDTLLDAAKVAYEEKYLLAMGIEPRYPNPGYGHIKMGKKFETVSGTDFYVLDKFVEKPPLELAKKYTESGEYLWNAGQFVWRADSLLESFKVHAPEIYKILMDIEPHAFQKEEAVLLKEKYEKMPSISVDYAIAEKEKNFLVVAADFYWTDIGDWKEVWSNLPKDSGGNVIISTTEGGEVINIDSTDALIHTDGRVIAAVDVDNIVIIDTKDALLVTTKSRAQSVKKVVERLKEEKRTELL